MDVMVVDFPRRDFGLEALFLVFGWVGSFGRAFAIGRREV
jgi:hypothetical protein